MDQIKVGRCRRIKSQYNRVFRLRENQYFKHGGGRAKDEGQIGSRLWSPEGVRWADGIMTVSEKEDLRVQEGEVMHNGTCSYQTNLSLSLFNLRKLANNQYLILHKSVRAKLDGKLDVIRVRIKMQMQFSFKCDQKPTGPSHCYYLNILNFFQILCNISEHVLIYNCWTFYCIIIPSMKLEVLCKMLNSSVCVLYQMK